MARTVTRGKTRADHALALACATVKRFRPDGRTLDVDDMFSAALEGAATALHRYDESRGVPFASYAVTIIRCALLNEARAWDPLTRLERQKVREGGEVPRVILSLDAVLCNEDGDEEPIGPAVLADAVDVEAEALVRVDARDWRRLVAMLSTRDRQVIRARFWQGLTHRELALRMGLTPSRVDQLVKDALSRLRGLAEAYGLAPEGRSAQTEEAPSGEPAEQPAPRTRRAKALG